VCNPGDMPCSAHLQESMRLKSRVPVPHARWALQKRAGANATTRAKKTVLVTEIANPETQQEEM